MTHELDKDIIERVDWLRRSINENLDLFEQSYVGKAVAKLEENVTPEGISTETQCSLDDVLESLRAKSARVQELEAENYRLQIQYKDINQELGRTRSAHEILQEKYRKYKEYAKTWRDHEQFKNRHSERPGLALQNWYRTVQHPNTLTPTPPPFPHDISPSARGTPSSHVPSQVTVKQSVSNENQHHDLLSGHETDRGVLLEKAIATEIEPEDDAATQSDAPISGPLPEDMFKLANQPKTSLQDASTKGLKLLNETGSDGDSPTIISERSLKRKRPPPKNRLPADSGGPTSDVKTSLIKSEILSSSPTVAPVSAKRPVEHDSLDLDDVGDTVHTPKKRQRIEELRWKTLKASHEVAFEQDEDRLLWPDYARYEPVKEADSGVPEIKDENDNQPYRRPVEEGHQQYEKARKAALRVQEQAHNNSVVARYAAAEKKGFFRDDCHLGKDSIPNKGNTHLPMSVTNYDQPRPRSMHGNQDDEQQWEAKYSHDVLCCGDPHDAMLPRTDNGSVIQKRKTPPSRRDRGAAQIDCLAEDGENLHPLNSNSRISVHGIKGKEGNHNVSAGKSNKIAKATDAYQRLDPLLNELPPEKPTLPNGKDEVAPFVKLHEFKTPAVKSACRAGFQLPKTPLSVPVRHAKANIDKGTTSARLPAKTSAILGTDPIYRKSPQFGEPPEVLPEHEPLRARPLERLRLEDFKLNPAHGDYAYHETIRKHDERKSLSGCTDPYCARCRDFAKFAEQSGYARIYGGTTTPQQIEEENNRLLEEYVGGDKRRLRRMSPDEKKDILGKLKTQEFANKYGKHRAQFSRPPSPPGFWNVDMPSTQEHERNRAEAGRMEREKVQQRYWEAVRPNGVWVFADE